MFSTLVGALPRPPAGGDADADAGARGDTHRRSILRAQLLAQADAGIDLLSFAEPDAPTPDLVGRWREAATLAEELGGVPVKAAFVGPYSFRAGGPAPAAIDRARAAVGALLDGGCPLVEVHEPAATRIGTDERARESFTATQRSLTDGLGGHLCLAIVGGGADAAGPETIFAGAYASYLFDLIAGPDNWRLVVAAPPEAGIVAAALDPRPEVYEVPETVVWAAHYAASTGGRGLDRVGVATAGSLGPYGWDHALARLGVLAKAARIAALPPGEELARAVDPRAADIRSAAMGRYAPLRPNRDARRRRRPTGGATRSGPNEGDRP